MPEYIEREALLKDIEDEKPVNWTNSDSERQAEIDFDTYKEIIEIQPTADVVEVVRCKDCYYYSENKSCCINVKVIKSFYGCTVKPNEYCSHGKRKGVVNYG